MGDNGEILDDIVFSILIVMIFTLSQSQSKCHLILYFLYHTVNSFVSFPYGLTVFTHLNNLYTKYLQPIPKLPNSNLAISKHKINLVKVSVTESFLTAGAIVATKWLVPCGMTRGYNWSADAHVWVARGAHVTDRRTDGRTTVDCMSTVCNTH